jgi:hypothetical protein
MNSENHINGHVPNSPSCGALPAKEDQPSTADAPTATIQQSNNPITRRGAARRHTGNVARLPKDVRDQLSQMILDGIPYKEIKARLGDHGKTLTIKNISNWKLFGGLAEYVNEQDRLHDCRLRHELLEKVLTQDTGTVNYQAIPKMAVALVSEALIDLGPETLRKGLQQDPRNAYRLLNSLARLLSGGLRCEQYLLATAERKAKLDQNEAKPGGISLETRRQIEQELKLM